MKYETAWLCNGKNPKCKGREGCYYVITNGIRGGCSHTLERAYAIHKSRDPKKNPNWFDRFKVSDLVRYYERDSEK